MAGRRGAIGNLVHVVGFLLKSTLKSRIAMALFGVMIALTVLAVGTRIAVVRGGSDSYRPVNMLIEEPTPRRALLGGFSFLINPTGRTLFADPASILFNESQALSLQMSTKNLEDLLLVALPFIALLLGTSLSPHRESPLLTLLSAPIRRNTFFLGHVLAAGLILLLLLGAAFVAAGLLLSLVRAPWDLIRLLALSMAYAALYAMVFAGIGLWFGVLFKKRSGALMAGLVLIIVLVGVMPPIREIGMRTFLAHHRDSHMEYVKGGPPPTEPLWYLTRAITHTPANALKTILWLTESFSPVSRAGCITCGGLSQPGRGYEIPGEAMALAIAALSSVLLGGIAFVRKEVEAP